MIQPQSLLNVVDNSGASKFKCIRILKGSKARYGHTGDIVVGSIRKLRLKRKVSLGEVHYGLITKTVKPDKKKDGSFTVFKTNSVILLNKKKRIYATRILDVVSIKLRQKKFMRILLMTGYNYV
jgi:large subunit ribosomal protein L14